MKKIILFAVVLFTSSSLFAQNTERILNIDDCVNLALNINYDILINKESVLLAEQRTKEAKSLYWPIVDLNLNGSKFSNDVPTIINSTSLPTAIYLPDSNRDYYVSARVSLWQNIYNGGKTVATNKLAKMYYEQMQNSSEIKKNEVLANVQKQFYKNISTQEKINLYKKYLSQNNSSVIKDKIEILEHQYELDMIDFLSLLGLELDTIVELKGEIKFEKLDLDLQQCLLWAYQFRPEIKTTQYQESIDAMAVNLISMEKYPTVAFGASCDWIYSDTKDNERDWYVSLNLNYPIFNGGAIFSKIKQKKIKARQATIERAKIEEKIKLEVRKAFNEYNFWCKKLEKLNNSNGNTIEQKILKLDTTYKYIESLINLSTAIGKQSF